MSNGDQGRASALPAVPSNGELSEADQWEADALAAIDAVNDPDEAEELLRKVTTIEMAMRLSQASGDRERRWRGMRLMAEARYGEILLEAPQPKAKPGPKPKNSVSTTHGIPDTERTAQKQARKVAEAKEADPQGFTDYVENNPAPSRSGLMRKVAPKLKPKDRPRPRQKAPDSNAGLWKNEDVLAWVKRRLKAGRNREEIMAESKAGSHGWPLDGQHLPQNAVDRAKAIVEDREQVEAARKRRPKAKSPGARMREIGSYVRKGNPNELLRLQLRVSELVWMLDTMDVEDYNLDDQVLTALVDLHGDLVALGEWWIRTLKAVQARLDDVPVLRKIEALRAKTVANGATPEEQESAHALADRLEETLQSFLTA